MDKAIAKKLRRKYFDRQIISDVGKILIGFFLYEMIYGKWDSLISSISFAEGEFGIIRALVSVATIIFVTFSITSNDNWAVYAVTDKESPFLSFKVALFCAFISTVVAFAFMGMSAGFCLIVAYALIFARGPHLPEELRTALFYEEPFLKDPELFEKLVSEMRDNYSKLSKK